MSRKTTAVKPTVITSTELADRLGDVLDRAFMGEHFEVTRYGKSRMYIVGPVEYERLTGQTRETVAA